MTQKAVIANAVKQSIASFKPDSRALPALTVIHDCEDYDSPQTIQLVMFTP